MSVDFSRIADRYDLTRGFPPHIEPQIGPAFAAALQLPAGARLLEIGVGTGRIALPLAAQGFHYIGVDISRAMMQQLRQRKAETQRIDLVQANAVHLPLASASFDAAVAVHVFHLIDGWEQALEHVVRAIRPGGRFAHGYGGGEHSALYRELRQDRWREIVRELGGEAFLRRPGRSFEDVGPALTRRLGQPEHHVLARWPRTQSPRDLINHIASRQWSDTWEVPDEILHESVVRLTLWAESQFDDLDTVIDGETTFEIDLYSIPAA